MGFDTENIPNMIKEEILDNIPKDWSVTENNGFIHVRDADGIIRIRFDPPDSVTSYPHEHLFNKSKNPLDILGNIVNKKTPGAHIPYSSN
ncbi:hypothetical protein [Clostridium sp. UBA7503]|uniref:hypothetical protein n=1 Tax=Clostridium sp. UBA7503 TaxID=1946377 RepID=UPI003218017A